MSETCPTVKIVNEADEEGFSIINESDFVEGEHELFEGESGSEASMTKGQLKEELTKLEVEFTSSANKAELQKLLDDKLAE